MPALERSQRVPRSRSATDRAATAHNLRFFTSVIVVSIAAHRRAKARNQGEPRHTHGAPTGRLTERWKYLFQQQRSLSGLDLSGLIRGIAQRGYRQASHRRIAFADCKSGHTTRTRTRTEQEQQQEKERNGHSLSVCFSISQPSLTSKSSHSNCNSRGIFESRRLDSQCRRATRNVFPAARY